jgi:hypothetical protein
MNQSPELIKRSERKAKIEALSTIRRTLSINQRNQNQGKIGSRKLFSSQSLDKLDDSTLSLHTSFSLPDLQTTLDQSLYSSCEIPTLFDSTEIPKTMDLTETLNLIPHHNGSFRDISRFIQSIRFAIEMHNEENSEERIIRYCILKLIDSTTYLKIKDKTINNTNSLEREMRAALSKNIDPESILSEIRKYKIKPNESISDFSERFRKKVQEHDEVLESLNAEDAAQARNHSKATIMRSFIQAMRREMRVVLAGRDFDNLAAMISYAISRDKLLDDDETSEQTQNTLTNERKNREYNFERKQHRNEYNMQQPQYRNFQNKPHLNFQFQNQNPRRNFYNNYHEPQQHQYEKYERTPRFNYFNRDDYRNERNVGNSFPRLNYTQERPYEFNNNQHPNYSSYNRQSIENRNSLQSQDFGNNFSRPFKQTQENMNYQPPNQVANNFVNKNDFHAMKINSVEKNESSTQQQADNNQASTSQDGRNQLNRQQSKNSF